MMSTSFRDRVGRGFELLAEGLEDFVDQVMTGALGPDWTNQLNRDQKPGMVFEKNDPQVQLRAITEHGFRFKNVLSRAQQGFASELREDRNMWAHNQAITGDNAVRTLDTIERLLLAVDATDSAEDVRRIRLDLTRTIFEDQTRQRVRKQQTADLSSKGVRPWREVAIPHDDVATGQFSASEFAADLDKVSRGEGGQDYSNPTLFFSRTYVTSGLKDLLGKALRRLNGDMNASPVVNLQTNFGGGKTHSMLSLYHLFSGASSKDFSQEIQELVRDSGVDDLAALGVKRVVLVGTALRPGSATKKEDGTRVNTIWGELAWQLGGREAFELIRDSDEMRTNPGSDLGKLLRQYGPALILIDEWVAYARQLVDREDLPAGSFETQFTFAQSLTEEIKSAPGCMLVLSVPASDSRVGEEPAGSMLEVGGENGKRALDRLQNVVRRVADQWRPSSPEESFEIVRRRLFKEMSSDQLNEVAAIAKHFVSMYRENGERFPKDTKEGDYEARIRRSYPIHPELLDRLYRDWSTLERFQRTRGVLHLMSSVVHSLWIDNDNSPMILPGNVPLYDSNVSQAMAQYLPDAWKPLLDSEIDSPNSVAGKIDADKPALGQRSLTRRIARTIFVGSAPTLGSPHKGLEEPNLFLGVAVPGDVLGNFSLAIDLLSQRSAYFYIQDTRVWFDTHPSIQRTAQELAESLSGKPELAWKEIIERLEGLFGDRGQFSSVVKGITSSADVLDNEGLKLAVLHPKFSYARKDGDKSSAFQLVNQIVEKRGGAPRIHRNTLVVAICDSDKYETLLESTRNYLAWKSISDRHVELNLDPQSRAQADSKSAQLSSLVNTKLNEAYQWIAVPIQDNPKQNVTVDFDKIEISDEKPCHRIATKLKRSGLLVDQFSTSAFGTELNQTISASFKGGHKSIGEVWGYFTRFPYLPKLTSRAVFDQALLGLGNQTLLEEEEFALAESFDESTGKYRNLVLPLSKRAIQISDSALFVDIEIAKKLIQEERKETKEDSSEEEHPGEVGPDEPTKPEAFSARFSIRVRSDFNKSFLDLSENVLDHLRALGSDSEVEFVIHVKSDSAANSTELRVILENLNALGYVQKMD
jgi:hypothetical protein